MENPDFAHATPAILHKRLEGSPSQETPTARNSHCAMKEHNCRRTSALAKLCNMRTASLIAAASSRKACAFVASSTPAA